MKNFDRFTINIETGNAAFTPEPQFEIGRILDELADKMKEGFNPYDGYPLKDCNGNRVGEVVVTEEEDPDAEPDLAICPACGAEYAPDGAEVQCDLCAAEGCPECLHDDGEGNSICLDCVVSNAEEDGDADE